MDVEFKDEDFLLFNKRYFFADKIFDKYEIEVNAGMFKVKFDIEFIHKESRNVLAKGRYSSLKELNEDVKIFLLKNESFLINL